MATDFVIKPAARKIKRDINKVLGNDLKKYLTELLTNSDDSYTRLEKAGRMEESSLKPIMINLSRRNRLISVVDNAEGMSKEDLKDKFLQYGADTSSAQDATTVRGMFGQGATDVLMSAAVENKDAKIISIKNNICTECHFVLDPKDDEKKIRFPEQPIDINRARAFYHIPENGTAVIFEVPKAVKIDNKLKEQLQDFYMLRFLFSKNNRKVVLHDTDTGTKETIRYDGEYFQQLKLLEKASFQIKYKNDVIKGTIELRQNKEKRYDKGIFVCDDSMVAFDEQFFERKSHSGMEQIEGIVVLEGLSKLVRYYLNVDQPEEIIKDDRDGFNTKHDFYRLLRDEIAKYIIKATAKVEENKRENLPSLKDDKRFAQAFKMLNKYFKDELEEVSPVPGDTSISIPPAEGLRFIRQKIKITKGKQYAIKLLVNTTLLPGGTFIDFTNQSEANFELNKKRVMVPYDPEENPILLDLSLLAKEVTMGFMEVKAEAGEHSTSLFVEVIQKEIHYPKYGLEFFPGLLHKKPQIESKGFLYVDLSKYPLGTEISASSESTLIDLREDSLIVSEHHMVSDEIAVMEIHVKGGQDGDRGMISAKAKNYKTKLEVVVSEKEEPDYNKGGLISDIRYHSTNPFVQTYYDAEKGWIVINTNNIINQNILEKVFKGAKIESQEVRSFIIDLASTEAAKMIVRKKIDGGKISVGDHDEYFDQLQKEKLTIYNIFDKGMKV